MLREVIVRESRRAPVVVIVENVHWIDVSSEDFLKSLAEQVRLHAVLLLLTTRSGSPRDWLSGATTETIALEGLDPSDIAEMIRRLSGAQDVSKPLLDLLFAKGEGNPLYVEEIVRQLQETEGILVEDGEARLRASDVSVPETIHDIIAARVDRLEQSPKQTLQVASVVGRRFGVTLVSRVRESDHGVVTGDLQRLHAVDFVFPSAQDPEPMYSFKHALTQDVVYTSLLERRRRRFHAAAGAGLEELYAGRLDEVVELLAYHFSRSAEDEKAVDYAILAAEKAQRRWANTEALALFETALARLASMPETEANRLRRIDAVIKQAEVKFALGRHAEHVEALEGIKDLVDGVADPPRQATWYYWSGFLLSLVGGHPEKSIAYCREAIAIAAASSVDDVRPFAECCLAHVLMAAGDLGGAIEMGERALAAFERRGNVWWACRALWALSPAANYVGDWERGIDYGRRALSHGQSVDDLRLKIVGWWRTGSTYIQRGDAEPGVRCCENALALSPAAFDTAMIRAVHGYGLVKAGEPSKGVEELEEAVAWFERSRLHYTRSLFALWLAEARLVLGQTPDARALLASVLDTTRDKGYRHLEGVAERLQAEAVGPSEPEGLEHLERAARILQEVGAKNEVAKALVVRSGFCRAAGDYAGARAALEQALAIFMSLGTVDGPRVAISLLDSLPGDVDTASAKRA